MANFGGISFGSDQEMSRWNFENRMQISGLGLPALPWETGVFSQIFVPGQVLSFPLVNLLRLLSPTMKSQPKSQLQQSQCLHVVFKRFLTMTMKVAVR